jgi:hypothetical protein
MQFRQDANGKLTLVVPWRPEFEGADLWPQDLQSAKDRANRILLDTTNTKAVKKLARQTLQLTNWVEREVSLAGMTTTEKQAKLKELRERYDLW